MNLEIFLLCNRSQTQNTMCYINPRIWIYKEDQRNLIVMESIINYSNWHQLLQLIQDPIRWGELLQRGMRTFEEGGNVLIWMWLWLYKCIHWSKLIKPYTSNGSFLKMQLYFDKIHQKNTCIKGTRNIISKILKKFKKTHA